MKIDKNDLFNRNMQKPLKSIQFSWNDLVISEETGKVFKFILSRDVQGHTLGDTKGTHLTLCSANFY